MDTDAAPVQSLSTLADNHGCATMSHLYASFGNMCTLSAKVGNLQAMPSISLLPPKYRKSRSELPTYRLHACGHLVLVLDNGRLEIHIGRVSGCWGMRHECHSLGAVYYLFTAYTERAFLHPFRLFKHPLTNVVSEFQIFG